MEFNGVGLLKHKFILFICIGILAGGMAALFLFDRPDIDNGSNNDPSTIVERGSVSDNSPAPVFLLPDISGNRIALDDYLGKVVIINFWATWCIPCKQEIPILNDISQEYPEDIVFLGVNVGDNLETVRKYIEEVDVSYPILIDETGVVGITYHVVGYPTTYFVDTTGIIRGKYVGLITHRIIQQYLTPLGIEI